MAGDSNQIIQGEYFDGHSSKAHAGFIHADEDAIHILPEVFGDFPRVTVSHDKISLDSKIGTAPRVLRLPEGASFMCPQSPLINEIAKSLNKKEGLLHLMESRLHIALAALILSIASIYSIVTYGIPFTAKTLAFHLPESTFLKDESVLSVLDKTLFNPSELPKERQAAIRHLLAPYLDSYQALEPKLHFRKMDQPNALALMSGDIVFTDAFINLAENNEEILSVFFHEIGHLEHKHFLRRLIQDTMISVLVVFILGDIEMPDLVAGAPTLLLDLSYSREFEQEADRFALAQMTYFDIPVNALARILTKLTNTPDCHDQSCHSPDAHKHGSQQQSVDWTYLSSHPSTPERIAAIERFNEVRQTLTRKEDVEGLTGK